MFLNNSTRKKSAGKGSVEAFLYHKGPVGRGAIQLKHHVRLFHQIAGIICFFSIFKKIASVNVFSSKKNGPTTM